MGQGFETARRGSRRVDANQIGKSDLPHNHQDGQHGHGGQHGQSTMSTQSTLSTSSTTSTPSTAPASYPEIAANGALALIAVASTLLSRQIATLEKAFVEAGGFTER